jgi:hypothetical protein
MIRLPAAAALAGSIALVLVTNESDPVIVLVGVAASLGLGGILGCAFSLVGASAAVLVVAYSLALAIAAPAPGVVIPVLLGVGLTVLLVTSEAVTRGGGAPVDRRVLAGWLGEVTGAAGLAGVGGIVLGLMGGTVVLDLPAWGYPVVAAVGVLAVVVGTGRALIASAGDSRVDREADP